MAFDGGKYIHTLYPGALVYQAETAITSEVPQVALQSAYAFGRYANRLIGIQTYSSNLSPVGVGTATPVIDTVQDNTTFRSLGTFYATLPPFPGDVRVQARLQFKHVGPYDSTPFTAEFEVIAFEKSTVPGAPTQYSGGYQVDTVGFETYASQRDGMQDVRVRDGIYSHVISTPKISWTDETYPDGAPAIITVHCKAYRDTLEAIGIRPVSTIVTWEIDD